MAIKPKPHSHLPNFSLDELYARLRENDLKLTPPRKVILAALYRNHGPFSAEELYSQYAKKTCDLATVYRTLISLEETKMVQRCEFGDGIARYELLALQDAHHHHHLVCKACKKIEVVDIANLEKSIAMFAKKSKFKGVSHILEFFGTCPDCQAS
jgi:Fur family ferric uptake transcriptional regulator